MVLLSLLCFACSDDDDDKGKDGGNGDKAAKSNVAYKAAGETGGSCTEADSKKGGHCVDAKTAYGCFYNFATSNYTLRTSECGDTAKCRQWSSEDKADCVDPNNKPWYNGTCTNAGATDEQCKSTGSGDTYIRRYVCKKDIYSDDLVWVQTDSKSCTSCANADCKL